MGKVLQFHYINEEEVQTDNLRKGKKQALPKYLFKKSFKLISNQSDAN